MILDFGIYRSRAGALCHNKRGATGKCKHFPVAPLYFVARLTALRVYPYSTMEATVPDPTVRPPSRIANLRPSSIGTGWISSTVIVT